MIITVTERAGFMRCRQAWDWGSYNRQSYGSVIHKPALAIGSLYHATQAEWSLHPEVDPVALCAALADQEITRIQTEYYQRIGAPISPIELDPVYDGIGMVVAMIKNYHQRWGSPLPDGFRMVSPEQTCVIPIPNTEHACTKCCPGTEGSGCSHLQYNPNLPSTYHWEPCPECSGTGTAQHYLSGTLDGLIQSEDGRVYVLERKTYGQRPKVEVLNMQDQFLAYLWILRELGIGEVGGLAYDGAWKRKEPPRASTLEDLFLRTLLHRNSHELDRFTGQLTAIALDMANNPAIYINRRWDGCWDCDFVEPCIAQERGEDYMQIFNTKFTKRLPSEDSTRELKGEASGVV